MSSKKVPDLNASVFGFRKTRSGVPFSPWDADAAQTLLASPSVDLDLLYRQALLDRTHDLEEGGEEENEVVADLSREVSQTHLPANRSHVLHPPPSLRCGSGLRLQDSTPRSHPFPIFSEAVPCPTPSDAPSASPPPRAGASGDPRTRGAVQHDGLTKEQYHQATRRKKQRAKRRIEREKEQAALGDALKASARKYRAASTVIKATDFKAIPANVHIAKTGVIGRASRSLPWHRKSLSLKSALKLGFQYVRWSGENSSVVVDSQNRAFTILSSHPNDPQWPEIIKRATERFVWAQQELAAGDLSVPQHRRGGYWSVNSGFSIGGGQTRVENLAHTPREQRILDVLLNDPDICRIANFASGSLLTHAPDVHKYYEETMDALLAADSSLRRNFVNNVFAAATFNLGPRAVTHVHLDHLNLAFGLCAVTALGNYDYKKGGHIVLWDAKMVIEFLPGSTILLPSAIIRHSNVAIQSGETRHSLTQYSAGGLFRWTRCGFRSQKDYLAAGFDMQTEYDDWKDGYLKFRVVS